MRIFKYRRRTYIESFSNFMSRNW